jgi:hypothetical protein
MELDLEKRAYDRGFAEGSGQEGWYQRRIALLEDIIAEVDKIAEMCPMSATTRDRLVKQVMRSDSASVRTDERV